MWLPRWSFAVLAVVFLILAVAFGGGIAADFYARISAEHRAGGLSTMEGVSAANEAVRLQPWRSAFRSDLGWLLGVRGDLGRMRAQYRTALRWSPANAYLWLDYAQALARANRFDSEYTLALRRATHLSPNARPVQMATARMGAMHWGQGGEQDRKVWSQSMTYALRTAPYELLWSVLRARGEDAFCGHLGAEFALERWCFAVRSARQLCDGLAPDAKGIAADQCKRLGLAIPTDEAIDQE
jgi:hypothetical protein